MKRFLHLVVRFGSDEVLVLFESVLWLLILNPHFKLLHTDVVGFVQGWLGVCLGWFLGQCTHQGVVVGLQILFEVIWAGCSMNLHLLLVLEVCLVWVSYVFKEWVVMLPSLFIWSGFETFMHVLFGWNCFWIVFEFGPRNIGRQIQMPLMRLNEVFLGWIFICLVYLADLLGHVFECVCNSHTVETSSDVVRHIFMLF